MTTLHWDVETRSAADLTKVGTRHYAADPSTVVLCVAYAVDDAEPTIWLPGQPVPWEFIEAAADGNWLSVTHNDVFEREIEAQILHPKYGWPIIPLAGRRCSMALAQANGLPGSLEEAAALLGLTNQKDMAGHELMLELCDASIPLDLVKLEELFVYCMQDVRTERELYGRFPPLTPDEQKVWEIDQTINARGFAVDLTLAQAARKIAAEEKKDINARISALTNGEITTAGQNKRILNYIRERGHKVKSLGKRNVAQILARNPDEETRQILELRRAGGRTSVTKFHTVITDADADDRIRDTFRYYGSHTGRWAGRSFQPQNLPKVTIADIDAATDAVLSGDHARVRSFNGSDTLSILSNVVRNVVIAKPGHALIGADFSAVESRVLTGLADERWKLANYREYDRTGDPKLEPYCVTASRMLHREVTPDDAEGRQKGKVGDLGLGFAGGVPAWRKFMPDDPRSDEQIMCESIRPWRAAHPAIRRFWKGIERLFQICVRTGKPATYGKIAAEMVDGALRLTLPSSRCLVYRDAKLGPGRFENSTDLYFHNGYEAAQAWFGTIVENIVQGISRDLLAGAMLRLESAGFPIVLHCHDEVVCEVPEDRADEARFIELMVTLPAWAEGLPIAAKPWTSKRYGKSNKARAQEIDQDEEEPDDDVTVQKSASTENVEESCGPTSTSQPDAASMPDEDDEKANDMDAEQAPPWKEERHEKKKPKGKDDGAKATNGHDRDAKSDYHNGSAGKDADKPYPPIRAALLAKGYLVAQTFPFTVPGATDPLFYEDRYELRPELAPSKQRPKKTCRFWHRNNGQVFNGTGPRRIIYNWPAIMAAGPGAIVFITEGANKSAPLDDAGLLATAAPYHKWEPECVSALAGDHLIYLEDHDLPDERGCIKAKEFSADARKQLSPVAASFRIVPALHLWKKNHTDDPPHGWDVKNWIEAGGDPAKLLEICCEIPADGTRLVYINMSQWDYEPAPEQEWAVYNRIPIRQCVLFSGEGATGKSTVQLHLTAAIVLNRDWLGAMPTQGPAIFIDAEDDDKVLHRRLKAIAAHYDTSITTMIEHGLRLVSWVGSDATLAVASRNGKIEPTALYRQLLEEAGDIRPIMIGIAASANVFAGSENDRAQVQQFVGLLTRIAMVANGSVALISHPSLTGIASESGLSGTTQWHNAVRARYFLRGAKPTIDEPLDTDLREIVFKKNQYGPLSESIMLRWNEGLFLPVGGDDLDQAARQAIAQEVFMSLLKRFRDANRNVSGNKGPGYAPALFVKEDEAKRAGLTSKNLEAAMRQLFKENKITNEQYGRASNPHFRLIIKP